MNNLNNHKNEALNKALDSLARYKFMQLGYWAAIWVHLNKIDVKRESNPFKNLVLLAKKLKKENEL